MRIDGRKNDEIRKVEIIPNYLIHAEGSCLISFGKTKVLCAATIEDKVPSFLKGTGQGWVTAEYSLLPRSTETRTDRESVKGKQSGRTHEIQRLIGRSLRAAVDLSALGERQIKIDCDVIQADGGTRTASICGACVALGLALKNLNLDLKYLVAAISCGVIDGEVFLDLNYSEDSRAEVDANFVMVDTEDLVEIQATGERSLLKDRELLQMLAYSRDGLSRIFEMQRKLLQK